jgi:2-amino-4-hydroxy-6-hydroxymethyldihydropteridine diphosphokinase
MKTAYVGIGSNLGDRHQNCLRAIELMREIPGCDVAEISGWYSTRPVGVEGQEWYENGVACLRTRISARELLVGLLSIEERMGRVRTGRWAPRVIDLDILLFGADVIESEDLKVPHPLMHLRRFVLMPLAQLAPYLIHPSLGLTIAEMLMRLPEDGQEVVAIKD